MHLVKAFGFVAFKLPCSGINNKCFKTLDNPLTYVIKILLTTEIDISKRLARSCSNSSNLIFINVNNISS